MHTIVPIPKFESTFDPSNYRTIIIDQTLARLYGSALEVELSRYVEEQGLRAPKQATF